MKKIILTIIGIIMLSLLGMFIYHIYPVKFAIQPEEIEYEQYIVVEHTYTTDAHWIIFGDENGFYEEPVYVMLSGNYPKLSYNLQTGSNRYVCRATNLGPGRVLNFEDVETYDVHEWEILYPVDHNAAIPLPKFYICRWDL